MASPGSQRRYPTDPDALLYRARLEAVRRQAAADGAAIDPWHLAATLEGVRLRMDHALHVVDRGAIFAAARTAFGLHQWLTAPDFDQEGAVQATERHLAAGSAPGTLLGAAVQVRTWLAAFGARCREAGVRPSMGSVGDAYDNAMCESFFATLECELLARRRFASQTEAKMAVFSYIEGRYNPARRHSGIGYLSPIAYETLILKKAETT